MTEISVTIYHSVKCFMYQIYTIYIIKFCFIYSIFFRGDVLIPGDTVFFLNVFLFKLYNNLVCGKSILCVGKHKLCAV